MLSLPSSTSNETVVRRNGAAAEISNMLTQRAFGPISVKLLCEKACQLTCQRVLDVEQKTLLKIAVDIFTVSESSRWLKLHKWKVSLVGNYFNLLIVQNDSLSLLKLLDYVQFALPMLSVYYVTAFLRKTKSSFLFRPIVISGCTSQKVRHTGHQ